MKIRSVLWFDLSEDSTGWAYMENSKLVNFGKFSCRGANFAETLVSLYNQSKDLINKLQPSVVGIEDIYLGKNPEVFRILAGLQAMVVYNCYKYNQTMPFLATASAIRKYEDFNANSKTYAKKFKDLVDFTNSANIRIFNDKVYDITNPEDLKAISKTNKDGSVHVYGSKIKEFDYVKKMVIVERVNALFGDTIRKFNGALFSYVFNDVSDACYSAYVLDKFIINWED